MPNWINKDDLVDNSNKRIFYIEPNDVYGKDEFNVVPYEDLCISVNLSCEILNRNGEEIGDGSFTISCQTGATERQNFLQGMGKHNNTFTLPGDETSTYLTTYYTNISGDDIANEQIIEGLGIESIAISFENYYAPRVQIKFVDVRGAALFGREETIHNEAGRITGENVFGAFFTIPYPKFRLQIKGFYGRPVTFQLTCESFKGNFNASNGNFEANVSLIGYQYSLLTDIPMRYLIAAPLQEEYGREYWENNVNTERWALTDGKPPMTLFELVNLVKTALMDRDSDKGGLTPEERDKLTQLADFQNEYETLSHAYEEFVDVLRKSDKNGGSVNALYNENDDNEQIVLMYSAPESQSKPYASEQPQNYVSLPSADTTSTPSNYNTTSTYSSPIKTIKMDESVITSQNSLHEAINTFNEGVSDSDIKTRIGNDNYVNGKTELWTVDKTFSAKRFIQSVQKEDGTTEICVVSDNYVASEEYYPLADLFKGDIKINDIKLTDNMKSRLQALVTTETDISKIGEYWLAIDLRRLKKVIQNGNNLCMQEIDKINKAPSERTEIDVNNVLGFVPNIGNIFKITMCHLETFCHIMYSAANQIDSEHRTPTSTKFGIENTDVANIMPNSEQVYGPFPGVYNHGIVEGDCGDEDENVLRKAWVGDFPNNPFTEEEKVVKGFIKATQAVATEIDRKPNTIISGQLSHDSMPLMPTDVLTDYNDFRVPDNATDDNTYISVLCGQLGIRAANIFGILNGGNTVGGDASLYGEMDAINYYMALQSSDKLQKYIIGNSGDDLKTRLIDIMLCNNDGQPYATKQCGMSSDKKHEFETDYVSDEYSQTNRHPMFCKSGSDYKYCHYYDANGNSIVPAFLTDRYSEYTSKFIMEDISNSEDKKKVVYFKPTLVDDYFGGDQFSNGKLFLYNNCDYPGEEGNLLEQYVNTSMFDVITDKSKVDDYYTEYQKLTTETKIEAHDYTADISKFKTLYDKHWKFDISNYNSMLKSYGGSMLAKKLSGTTTNPADVFSQKDSLCGSELTSTSDRGAYNDYYIHEMNVWDLAKDKSKCESLFAHEMYYMQNGINDTITRNRCKCLLMLHTLKYEKPKDTNWLFRSSKKTQGTIELLPYGQLLLLGGLLWRQNEPSDPIISKEDSLIYYGIKKDNTLLSTDNYFVFWEQENNYISIKDYFGVDKSTLDYRYQNRLISLFKNFADSYDDTFGCLEIKTKANKPFKGTSFSNLKKGIIAKKGEVDKWFNRVNWTDLYAYIRSQCNIFKQGSDIVYKNTVDTYLGVVCNGSRLRLLINDDEAHGTLQDNLRNLYARDVAVFDSLGTYIKKENGDKGAITVNGSDFESYIDGFANTLSKICKEKTEQIPGYKKQEEIAINPETFSREIAIDIYFYLKNIWDKWLVIHHKQGQSTTDKYDKEGQDYFNTDNFFTPNFIFIDKFYLNIFNLLICNADKVADAINDIYSNRDASLFSFLSQICSDHGCMLFAMPDFINFGRNIKEGSNALVDAFTAFPYSDIGKPREENKFVIMYADHPSDTMTDKNGHKTDSFDIKPTENNENVPPSFKNVPLDTENVDPDNNMLVHGYGVPAFGVSFGRQKQSIFKNINVNMNNPMTTSVSIQATTDIANMGKDSARRVYFQGQDTFSIYSNYSYECEVEMMGNAQIMPLMYFQLLNVPMWRGAYMIYKVTHNITPGNMITNFVGQKLSKISTPWCTKYAIKVKDGIGVDGTRGGGEYNASPGSGDYIVRQNPIEPHVDESKFDTVIPCDEYVQGVSVSAKYVKALEDNLHKTSNMRYVNGNYALRCDLAKMFLAIREEYEQSCGNTYSLCITSAVRDNTNSSEHNGNDKVKLKYKANAIDINIANKNYVPCGKLYKEMFRLVNVILTNHFNDIGQLIVEAYPKDNSKCKNGMFFNCLCDGSGNYKDTTSGYNCVHLSCGNKSTGSKYDGNKAHPEIFLSNGDFSAPKFKNYKDAYDNCAPEFVAIAGVQYWKIGCTTFRSCYLNFGSMTEDDLDNLFTPYKPESVAAMRAYDTSDDAKKYKVAESDVFHEVVKYLGMPYEPKNAAEVKRDSNGYPIIGKDERATLDADSKGMNGYSLVSNITRDLKVSPYPKGSVSSVGEEYNVSISKPEKPGDVILFKDNSNGKSPSIAYGECDVMMYLGKNRVVKVDTNGVDIIDFKEDTTKFVYEYRRHPNMKTN